MKHAAWIACWLSFAASTLAGGASPVRLLRSTSAGAAVEVTAPLPGVTLAETRDQAVYAVPDWSTCDDPGVPQLPCTRYFLALPPGTRAAMMVRVLASSFQPGPAPRPAPRCEIHSGGPDKPPEQTVVYDRNDAVYGQAYPEDWARLGEPVQVRMVRMVPIDVYPYRWDPAAGGVQVATRLQIDVEFVADQRQAMKEAGQRQVPVSDTPGWNRLYRQNVLNAAQAGPWMRAPAPVISKSSLRPLSTGPEFRIRVDHSDIYRVSYEDLVAAGWTATGVPESQLALVERIYDESDQQNPFHENPVPIVVRDNDGTSAFGPGDEIFFFGLDTWDRLHPPAKDKRYGRVNAYFLSVNPAGGVRMEADSSSAGPDGVTPDTSCVWTRRLEEDRYYTPYFAEGDTTPGASIAAGAGGIQQDHFVWTEGNEFVQTVPFELPGLVSPIRLRLGMQGIKNIPYTPNEAHVWFEAGTPDSLRPLSADSVVIRAKSRLVLNLEGAVVDTLHLARSGNALTLAEGRYAYGASLNWMEWTYRRDFGVDAGRVAWNTNGNAGVHKYKTGLFPAGADHMPLLFELTDSIYVAGNGSARGPRSLLYSDAQYAQRRLTVQLDLLSGGSSRIFLAVDPHAASTPLNIEQTSSRDLVEPIGATVDLITVTAPEFMDAAAPLMTKRQADGLATRLVSIEEIYDQFNGGRPWPTAIRNYLRYLWRQRGVHPSYLLLLGKANDDFANVTGVGRPNLVPTQTLYSYAQEDQGAELVGTDEWFVDNLSDPSRPPERLKFYPDMAVGRLPVYTVAQCETIVQKLITYGNFAESDSWRARGLFVADDEYSSAISFAGSYQFKGRGTRPVHAWPGTDTVFRYACEASARIIHNDGGFADFAADSFYTSCYMDTVACLGRCLHPIKPVGRDSTDCTKWRCPADNSYSGWRAESWYASTVPYALDTPIPDPVHDNYVWGSVNMHPKLISFLNGEHGGGYLLVNYEGHANRGIMSHEYIFTDFPYGEHHDVASLRNAWPFFFMGYGCHLAETSYPASDDCISDKLVLLDPTLNGGQGAIAAYASSAFEWLSSNYKPNIALFNSWFVDSTQVVNGKSRWVLGDLITGGKYRMLHDYTAADSRGMVLTYNLIGDPSMPMEMAPPTMNVRLCPSSMDSQSGDNCETWVDGNLLTAAAGSDTAFLRIRLADEARVGTITLLGEGGTAVPNSDYRIVPDTLTPGHRAVFLVYKPRLLPPVDDYDIQIKVADDLGMERSASLPVRLTTSFFRLRGGTPTPFSPSDILGAGDSVMVRVQSPSDLTENQIGLWVDDSPLVSTSATSANPRDWTVQAVLPQFLVEGAHQLSVRADRREDNVHPYAERQAQFEGPLSGAMQLREVYNFPNPFESSTRFHFWLSQDATWARLSVFTSTGRRIWQWSGSATRNENWVGWDGRDQDGDPVANGLYFYKLEVRDLDGHSLRRIDRVVRIR